MNNKKYITQTCLLVIKGGLNPAYMMHIHEHSEVFCPGKEEADTEAAEIEVLVFPMGVNYDCKCSF